jgi:hypothetical protein
LGAGADLQPSAIGHDHGQVWRGHALGHGELLGQGQFLETPDQSVAFVDTFLADPVAEAFDLLGAEVEAEEFFEEFVGLGKGAAARGYGDDLAEQVRGEFGLVDTEAARLGEEIAAAVVTVGGRLGPLGQTSAGLGGACSSGGAGEGLATGRTAASRGSLGGVLRLLSQGQGEEVLGQRRLQGQDQVFQPGQGGSLHKFRGSQRKTEAGSRVRTRRRLTNAEAVTMRAAALALPRGIGQAM